MADHHPQPLILPFTVAPSIKTSILTAVEPEPFHTQVPNGFEVNLFAVDVRAVGAGGDPQPIGQKLVAVPEGFDGPPGGVEERQDERRKDRAVDVQPEVGELATPPRPERGRRTSRADHGVREERGLGVSLS